MQPNGQTKLLIVDDEKDIRHLMEEIFSEEGYQVSLAANGVQARQAWRDQVPDLIFLDIWMPDIDGLSLLKEMQAEQLLEHTSVIMMSGHGTIQTAVEATRYGAYDFMEKPLSLAKLILMAERALEHNRLQHENRQLKVQQPGLVMPIGNSKLMRQQRDNIERLAKYTMPILLLGETGSGKAFFAQALHQMSPRKSQPFTSLSADKLNNELEDWLGSLTDDKNIVGKIEQTKGGTLVISHVEKLSPDSQACLADLLFHQAYRRCGSDKLHNIDLRIVCSSQADLENEVSEGRFREDIFKRLNVMPLIMPALRQHNEDLPDLVHFFVDQFVQHDGLTRRKFPEQTLRQLKQYSWPGNLRELKNLIQRLLILGKTPDVNEEEISLALNQTAHQFFSAAHIDTSVDLKTAKERFEASYLKQLLRETSGNVSEAAKRSGVERTHLYRKLKTLEIDPKDPI
ncbi:sigma-54-dependent Fis family transcriptional regulator [Thiomicrospira microaerophila]|uniref:sigma-54-dependent transcriptional regulator n=1 Tax=Thiomicrospira microaerophila TaxID=406020 RepID=UPI00200E75C1|nr:sigma-54 dependent transcriptional regulator [Thiomicrospira microaerophila]UQB42051.1 sigma-54-dependent Fis family transcriptional regulator [Thiomicrospira microaerophila]